MNTPQRMDRGRKGGPLKFGNRYPWAEWLARGRFTLNKGKDFNHRLDTMVTMIRHRIRIENRKRSERVNDDGIRLRAHVTIDEDEGTVTTVVKRYKKEPE